MTDAVLEARRHAALGNVSRVVDVSPGTRLVVLDGDVHVFVDDVLRRDMVPEDLLSAPTA